MVPRRGSGKPSQHRRRLPSRVRSGCTKGSNHGGGPFRNPPATRFRAFFRTVAARTHRAAKDVSPKVRQLCRISAVEVESRKDRIGNVCIEHEIFIASPTIAQRPVSCAFGYAVALKPKRKGSSTSSRASVYAAQSSQGTWPSRYVVVSNVTRPAMTVYAPKGKNTRADCVLARPPSGVPRKTIARHTHTAPDRCGAAALSSHVASAMCDRWPPQKARRPSPIMWN